MYKKTGLLYLKKQIKVNPRIKNIVLKKIDNTIYVIIFINVNFFFYTFKICAIFRNISDFEMSI